MTPFIKCHPKSRKHDKKVKEEAKRAFFKFKKIMSKAMYGNKIDWMLAEERGIIKPLDIMKGISLKP